MSFYFSTINYTEYKWRPITFSATIKYKTVSNIIKNGYYESDSSHSNLNSYVWSVVEI
jgi:hypothetical protein